MAIQSADTALMFSMNDRDTELIEDWEQAMLETVCEAYDYDPRNQ